MKYVIFSSIMLFLTTGCEQLRDTSVVLPSSENKSSSGTINLNESIGWIHGTCLAIRNGKIKPGTAIQMIVLDSPQKIVDTRVLSATDSNSECSALLSDRVEMNKESSRFFYNLALSKETQSIMAVGLVAAVVVARNVNRFVELDLNKDGIAEHAGMCLTSEGVQFYVSQSTVFDDKALWSDYYYLGYDNKPTCH